MYDFYTKIKTINKRPQLIKISLLVVLVFLFIYVFFFAPFGNKDVIIHIPTGQSANYTYSDLKNKNVVKSVFVLKIFVKLLKSGQGVVSGDYLINKNSPVWVVAWQIGRGHHNITPFKITIREGLTNKEISSLLKDNLTNFQEDLFLSKAEGKQGYLFPDTYFLYPLDTEDEIIEKLSNNFKNRTKNIPFEINNKSLSETVIMASILEGEANGKEDIKIISGILWKRISLGMPLQVDIDKETYTKNGLPVEPLNNPGLLSIEASFNPISSPYLYYIHDKSGKVHYAVTFEEHKRNINDYLK